MAKVHLYKDLSYELPKQPPKNEIAGHNLPKKQQRWQRVVTPEDIDELTQEERDALADKLDDYCTYGYWFYNNGEPTYITGDHFHYINEFMLDVGYPDFRDTDKRWFYHWDICAKDEECFGQIYGKKRRDGLTYRGLSILLNDARKTFKANYGIMSKTGTDAKECFLKLKETALAAYNPLLKPQEKTSSETKIWFGEPPIRITNKTKTIQRGIALNTTIQWRNTRNNSFDSMAIKLILCDEPGKWTEADLEIWYAKARKFLSNGSVIKGKIVMGSSVNEQNEGGDKFKVIWEGADYGRRNANGRTTSGVYRYFVPAYDGYEGHIDEYGFSVIETPEHPVMGIDGRLIKKGARQTLLDEREDLKATGNLVAYYEHKREFPFEEDDMFINPANKENPFDLDRIHEQIEHNNIHIIDNTLNYGYFQWKNGVIDSLPEWMPTNRDSSMCKWAFAQMPKLEEANRFVMRLGKKSPANTHKWLFTLDPFAAANPQDSKRASKAASHGFAKFDMMRPSTDSDIFISEYWQRPKDPLIVYEDMIMCCVYFGAELLPEKNLKSCRDIFVMRGYENYLLLPPVFTEQDYLEKLISQKKEDAGWSTNAKSQEQMLSYLCSYIANKIGVNPNTGKVGYMPFNNTLKDWLEFNVQKWTPYDLTVSSMLAIVGSRGITTIKQKEVVPLDIFPTFDNMGNQMY